MGVEIVEMDAGHVPQIAELERRCFQDPWSERLIAGELGNPLSLWLVALADGTVAGYTGSQAVLDQADLMDLAVSPDFRRQGLGTRLLHELEARLYADGVRALLLEVRPSNAPALALYGGSGFREVGRRKNYYLCPKEDALILRKELTE